jgi:hypothetical protein
MRFLQFLREKATEAGALSALATMAAAGLGGVYALATTVSENKRLKELVEQERRRLQERLDGERRKHDSEMQLAFGAEYANFRTSVADTVKRSQNSAKTQH